MPKSKEFITSSEDSDSDTEKRKVKKQKVEKKKVEKKPEKKPEKKAAASNSGGDENMFQLSRMRYATVSEFRGKVMVGIREYYEADGDLRPGKKGISLTMEQWNALKDHMDDIEDAIKKMS